jgi:hypothetical protein
VPPFLRSRGGYDWFAGLWRSALCAFYPFQFHSRFVFPSSEKREFQRICSIQFIECLESTDLFQKLRPPGILVWTISFWNVKHFNVPTVAALPRFVGTSIIAHGMNES